MSKKNLCSVLILFLSISFIPQRTHAGASEWDTLMMPAHNDVCGLQKDDLSNGREVVLQGKWLQFTANSFGESSERGSSDHCQTFVWPIEFEKKYEDCSFSGFSVVQTGKRSLSGPSCSFLVNKSKDKINSYVFNAEGNVTCYFRCKIKTVQKEDSKKINK